MKMIVIQTHLYSIKQENLKISDFFHEDTIKLEKIEILKTDIFKKASLKALARLQDRQNS